MFIFTKDQPLSDRTLLEYRDRLTAVGIYARQFGALFKCRCEKIFGARECGFVFFALSTNFYWRVLIARGAHNKRKIINYSNIGSFNRFGTGSPVLSRLEIRKYKQNRLAIYFGHSFSWAKNFAFYIHFYALIVHEILLFLFSLLW